MSFRKITVKSGNEEFTLEVTEEEYRNYFRPWWQQKKHDQRNREAMEQNANFERTCLSKHFGRYIPPESWHCSAVQAAMLALPRSLEDVRPCAGRSAGC